MKNIAYIMLMLAIVSCTKVLDQVPQDRITEDNFWKTVKDAEAAAAGIYSAIQPMAAQSPLALDAGSDLANPLLINYSPFGQHAIPVDNPIVNAYWQNNYIGIGRCNDLLKHVPGIDSSLFSPGQKERILGEAYFLRAYFYFNLVKAYGGVPIVTMPYQSFNGDFTIVRSTVAQVFSQIVADLKQAVSKLQPAWPANIDTRGRATTGSAHALLAKVYLSMKDYPNAAAEAKIVMDNPIYTLVTGASGYTNMFSPNGKNSAEGIFEIQYVSTSMQNNGLYSFYLPNGVPAGVQPGSYQIAPTAKIVNAFETGDLRKPVSIAYNNASTPLPYVNKYIRLTSGTEPNIIVLRLADIILVRAEALNNSGQTADAGDLLNIIRRRAFGLPPNSASSRDFPSTDDVAKGYDLTLAIENERMKELCFEGHRFYDLARTGRATTVLGITADKTLWPVPLREIGRNPRLEQNPGY